MLSGAGKDDWDVGCSRSFFRRTSIRKSTSVGFGRTSLAPDLIA
jgi:hypothetical protein